MTDMLTQFRSRPRVQGAFILVSVIVVAIHLVAITDRRTRHLGDFDVSREFGRRYVAGEPLYKGGLHYPYMPTAALSFAPLSLVDPGVGFLLRYVVALGCLWLTLQMLDRMVWARRDADASGRLAAAALTLMLASHYLLRDLDNGGPHLILLAIVVGGIYCVWKGRGGWARSGSGSRRP